jgi:eukaryotic-like serine/threonine-protein kinase
MDLEPGCYVTRRIRLRGLLRMGAVGSLWTAHDEALDREVAVKFISASLMDDPITNARFKREGRFTANINCPHVVKVYEHGLTSDGQPYIVMELLQGEDLSVRLERTGTLSLPEVGLLVSQLCAALAETHRVGIVHRDIKPSSIFLVDNGQGLLVKLLDFGLAKTSEQGAMQLTATGAVVGTLVYMSPEQFFDPKKVDGRADLWSVGSVAYRALTGRSPFREHKGMAEALASVRDDPVTSPSQLVPDLPPELDAWFDKALGRAPEARFQTAQEMAEALRLALGERAGGAAGRGTAPVEPEAPGPAGDDAPRTAEDRGPLPAGRVETATGAGRRKAASRRASTGAVMALLLAALVAYLASRAASRSDPASPAPTPTLLPDGSR